MTVAARMALTSLWHGNYGGVSRLGPLWRALSDMVLEQHPLIFSASVLQSLPFEDGAVTNHHHLSITLSSNGPHQTRQMKFIVACFVHVWCWHEIASAQLELRGGSFMFSQFVQEKVDTEDAARCPDQAQQDEHAMTEDAVQFELFGEAQRFKR